VSLLPRRIAARILRSDSAQYLFGLTLFLLGLHSGIVSHSFADLNPIGLSTNRAEGITFLFFQLGRRIGGKFLYPTNQCMELILSRAPEFGRAWEDHRNYWKGEEAGLCNDVAAFSDYIADHN
jgi:hypothetical protein